MNTAAVIVTFNKPLLLKSCLSGIFSQIEMPNSIFVIDNSADTATYNLCLTKLNINKNAQETEFGRLYSGKLKDLNTFYLSKSENDGGAGGFYSGIELAISFKFDYLWLMDDDGIPHNKSLYFLKKTYKPDSILNPLVVDINNHSKLSFWLDSKGNQLNRSDFPSGIITDNISPFNGTFFEKKIILKYGNIEKKMFIWGDEVEFMFRMKSKGINLYTVVNSIHYHPINKKTIILKLPYSICIRKIDNQYFEYLYYRNKVYINYKYYKSLNRELNFFKSILEPFINIIFHLLNFRFKRSKKILFAVYDGLKKNL